MRLGCSGPLFCLAVLTGCGGSQGFDAGASPMSRATTQRLALPAHHGPKLYVVEAEGDNFLGYRPPKGAPFCSKIQNTKYAIVNGIGTDSSGTLWVPTNIFSGSRYGSYIFSYAPNCGAQGTTLSAPSGSQPVGIAFASDATKYGLMLYQYGNRSHITFGASVAIYPTGATSPTAELTDPRLNGNYYVGGMGIDAVGKIYVSCCAGTKPKHPVFVIVFKSGQASQQRGRKIPLSQMQFPGSVTFDRSQNMLITDINTSTLKIYAPPYSGSPATYPLQGNSPQCALSRHEDLLACGDYDNQDVDIYAYPSVTYQYSLSYDNPSRIPPGGVAFARP